MKILIKKASIVDAAVDYPKYSDILVVDGIVTQIGHEIEVEADKVINGDGLAALPGFVDMHNHLREPGFEYKETVSSGTKAAARGGYTTICCMPNTKPVIDNEETLKILLDIINIDAVVNVLPIAAVSIGQQSQQLTEMKTLKTLGAIAFSDDGQPVSNNRVMLEALLSAKENGALIIDHCEDHSLVNGGVINKGSKAQELDLVGISNLSEELPVVRDIMLAAEADYKIHIAHVSTRGTVDIIREAKKRGVKVTCEVTPHHIALSDDMIRAGYTDCKVNPPLRSIEDVQAMKLALKDGTIDTIATDHAPHHETEKGNDFNKAANGISGIETSFSVCYTELVETGILSLKELVAKMSYNPSQLLGINKGRVAVGEIADITIVDLNKVNKIDKNTFLSKGKNTPFHGRSYKGEVVYTIVKGEIIYNREEIK
ncbi:MAG: dihydroorotase [Clostridia bacterium]|jgi:dihydroorotase|nr:dihydroorotase [Clostridia bacterium]